MKQKYSLSDIEWKIIQVIWEKKEATVKEVWHHAFPNQEKAFTTIQTYMERMVDKKLLNKRKIGLVNFFTAAIEQEQFQKKATKGFLSHAFRGNMGQFAAFLVNDLDLTPEELSHLQQLITEKGTGKC
jgi:predicted transcriptional regulator